MSLTFKEFMSNCEESQDHNNWGWFVDIEINEDSKVLPKYKDKHKRKSLYNYSKLTSIQSEISINSLEELEKKYGIHKESSWSLNATCIITILAFVVLAI